MKHLFALALCLVACNGAASPGGPGPTLPSEARNAPARVDVAGRSYTLQSDLYRDMMPGPAPTPRRGVGGTIFLRVDVESDPPQGMSAGKAWLVNGAEVWETVPQPLQTFAVDRRNHLSLSVRDGPVWDTSARVDVVLQFTAEGRTYFIQQRGVPVIGAL